MGLNGKHLVLHSSFGELEAENLVVEMHAQVEDATDFNWRRYSTGSWLKIDQKTYKPSSKFRLSSADKMSDKIRPTRHVYVSFSVATTQSFIESRTVTFLSVGV